MGRAATGLGHETAWTVQGAAWPLRRVLSTAPWWRSSSSSQVRCYGAGSNQCLSVWSLKRQSQWKRLLEPAAAARQQLSRLGMTQGAQTVTNGGTLQLRFLAEFQDSGPDSSRSNSRGDISTRHSNRRTSARNSSEGAGSKQQQRPPSSGGTSHLRPPPPEAQQQLGPLMSARSHSSNGGAVFSTQHSMLPPRPGPARHCRTASLGSDIAASAAADAASTAASARCSDSDMVGPASLGQTPEPASSSKRKLPGRAAMASQSCHLPNGFHSSGGIGLQGGAPPSTPPQASSTSAAAAGGAPWLSNSVEPGTLQSQQQQGEMAVGTPPPHMHSSCSKASIGGSCSRLVTFSQEDVPLSAFKPNPGKANRRSSTGTCAGVSSSAASAGASGWVGYGSKAGSLTGSIQQQQQGQGHAEGSSQQGSCGNGGGGGAPSVEGMQLPAQQQQQGGPAAGGVGSALHAAPAGLALLVASNAADAAEGRGGWQQVDPQYATMQSDICNYASWLEEPAPGHNTCAINQQQQLLDAGSQQQQQVPQQERSEGDMCNYEEPISPPACSPKQAVSPAPLSATKASSSPDTTVTETGDAAGVSAAAAAAAAAVGGRPTVLAAAWAYMSDMCNLGGSFDATSSTIGRSGLAAAVLSRFAADSSQQQQQQQESGTLEGSQGRPSSGSVSGRPSSSSSNGRKQQPAPGTAAAAAAAGSWPDTAPSPPHATLVAGSAAGCTPAAGAAVGSGAVAVANPTASANASGRGPAAACVSAAQADGCSRALAAASPAGVASKLRLPDSAAAAAEAGSSGRQGTDDEEEVSSPPRRKRRGAAGGAYPTDSSRSSSNGGAGTAASSGDSGRDGAAAAIAAAPSAVEGLDPQLLAAVTGTTSRDQLTASQEELAAKLARLAFANPASARQLAGAPPQQQQQQRQEQQRMPHQGTAVAVGSGEGRQQQHEQQARQQFEPFYPTVMSDMCNLADPDGEEPEELLERHGSQTNMRATGRAAAGSLQQQWQATAAAAAAAGGVRGPIRPPAAAAAAGAMAYKPQLPGRPIRQQAQQQQFIGAASRLGRSAMGGAAPPSSNSSTAAAAAAAGVGDTAGPLRAALLLRGMRAAPGGPKQLLSGANGSPVNAGAAGILSRRMAPPGDVAGDAGSAGAAACGNGGGVGGVLSMHALHGEESLVSFDSYYVDCDLRQPGDAAAMDAANMITNNPLYTFTASEGGGTADSTRFSPRLKQQLRDASDAAAEGGGSPGRGSPPYLVQQQQQQWHDPGVVRGGKVVMGLAAAGGGGGPAGSYEGRNASSNEHDDGVRQYDNSRSSSPALQAAADGAVFAAATAAVAGKVSRDLGIKEEVVGGDGSGYMGSLQGSAGARSKRQHRDVDAPGRDAAY